MSHLPVRLAVFDVNGTLITDPSQRTLDAADIAIPAPRVSCHGYFVAPHAM
ncbi:MAG: hypothetical protein PF501_01720 [Salinisphaera sp.]|jgi:hypothetical protein|nr:hypothetical protein [Salinisphaera sp.]